MTSRQVDPGHTRLLILIGTKAQLIKMAPVMLELDRACLPYRLVYTGQHSETFGDLERCFGTRGPDEVLVPDCEAATRLSFASWTLSFWSRILRTLWKREWNGIEVGLVHGDTASTLFGALAMRMAGVRVAHVEAGLRSPRLTDPFPEEVIRRLVSRASDLHFAPDAKSAARVARRGTAVDTGGNTLQDSLRMAIDRQPRESSPGTGGTGLVSVHRNENLSSRKRFDMLMQCVVQAASECEINFVMHPATRERLIATGWLDVLRKVRGLHLMERSDYFDFTRLLVSSSFLMTDGGSNQEEAAILGIPTLLLRKTTERADGLGRNVMLSALDPEVISEFIARNARGEWRLGKLPPGSPSRRIVDSLQQALR